jgi:hypothetical protein
MPYGFRDMLARRAHMGGSVHRPAGTSDLGVLNCGGCPAPHASLGQASASGVIDRRQNLSEMIFCRMSIVASGVVLTAQSRSMTSL